MSYYDETAEKAILGAALLDHGPTRAPNSPNATPTSCPGAHLPDRTTY